MTIQDHEYYRRRIADEAAAAKATPCEVARGVHLDLVARYSEKLRGLEQPSGDVLHLPNGQN